MMKFVVEAKYKIDSNSNKDTYLEYLRKNFEPSFLCSSLCSQPRDNLPYEDWQISLSFWYLTWKKFWEHLKSIKDILVSAYNCDTDLSGDLRVKKLPLMTFLQKFQNLQSPSWKDHKVHHLLLVLPQILHNTGFSELLHATFVSRVFTTRHFCFQQHYSPYTLKYLMQLPTVYIWKNQMSCVQSVQLSTLIFCRPRSYICTKAGSLNSKGHMIHLVIIGKNSIKSALGILQSSFQLSGYIQYRIEKKIVSSDLHVPGSY